MGSSKKKGDVSGRNVPSASKKIVQLIKEILNDNNYSDFDIYSALKESDMDADQAIQRLLSQDSFQEVKSKREKQKMMKQIRELKNQEKNSDATCAVSVGEEHSDGVASSESHKNSNDNGKSVDKRDNVLAGSAPSLTLVNPVKTSKQQPSPHSDTLSNDSTRQNSENRDSVSLSGKRQAATRVNWNRGTSYSGHMTMADIVRMGKPPGRLPQTAAETTYARQDSDSQSSSFNHLKPSHDYSHSHVGMLKDQQGSVSALPSDGQEALDIGAAEGYSEILSCKVIPNYLHAGDVTMRGMRNSISPSANYTASLNDKVSPNALDLQKPSLGKAEPRTLISEDTSALVFPNNVQDIATDLSHLSFGTYNSGVSTTVSESQTSDSLQNNLKREGLSAFANTFDPRNSWYADQILRCKKLELDKEASIPQVPNAYKYTSSSIPDSNYMNIIKPDARNPPLHGELQSRSLPPTSDFMRATCSVDPVIMSEVLDTGASLPVSYSVPLPGVSLAMDSALPQRATAFPQSALQHSYQGTGVFHDSLAGVKRSVPQFGSGATRNSWPALVSNDFLDGDLGTRTNHSRQFHQDIPIARSGVGYGGIQSQYNEDTRLPVLQRARNSQLSAWDYGSSMRAISNVQDGRSHSLPAQNQLLFGYPQTQQLVQNYEALEHSNVYNSQAGTIRDQQLGPGGLPFTQAQPSRPSDQFWQQRYQR